jgi:HD-like signal output (HDOD) protein
MQSLTCPAEVRRKILLQKEIPPLPLIAQRILSLAPDAEVSELARIIEQSPEIAARLIGMANAAYFGWPGGVRTIYDAIYKVLGIKLVKSLLIGMAMGDAFDVKKCRGFRPERYWFTAVVTAQLAQGLFPFLPQSMQYELENVHMDGLLHNFGIAVLAHLFPLELSRAFAGPPGDEVPPTTERIRTAMGVDQMQAGGWLARKWHLPRNIVLVMEHHKEPGYRGDFWPIVMLVAYCERGAQRLFSVGDMGREPETEALLGFGETAVDKIRRTIEGQLEELKTMVALMASGE